MRKLPDPFHHSIYCADRIPVGNIVSYDDWETTDVLICGCGPTGAMLSGYLGRMGIPNIILDKEPTITTDPRGIALDDDGIRLVQGLGLYEHIFSDIGSCKQHISLEKALVCTRF